MKITIMRSLQDLLCVLVPVGLAFLVSASAAEPRAAPAAVQFRWAMAAVQARSNDLVSITRDSALNSGDEIKMAVELVKPCFVYVIYQDSHGAVHRLFPYTWDQFLDDYKLESSYYIPKGPPWFRLDDQTGAERVFLLASNKRLDELEQILKRHENTTPEKQSSTGGEVVNEIRRLRKASMTFARPAERPATLGGSLRGENLPKPAEGRPDVAKMATEISTDNLYCRTFTIDHRK